jgi:catechol 2,3-dioxygenase-like lactoylglutathione lyase family enzyme
MLGHNDAIATIAVQDMARARKFYENTLGLEKESAMGDEVTTYRAGDTKVFVYKSDLAGGYDATVATWTVNDHIEDIVRELHEHGVEFEHYEDMEGVELQGDLHVSEGMKAAWFKDPDGNILCMVQDHGHPYSH